MSRWTSGPSSLSQFGSPRKAAQTCSQVEGSLSVGAEGQPPTPAPAIAFAFLNCLLDYGLWLPVQGELKSPASSLAEHTSHCPPAPGPGSGAHPVRPSLRELRARRGAAPRRVLLNCVPYKGLIGHTHGCSLGSTCSCSSLGVQTLLTPGDTAVLGPQAPQGP